MKTIQDIIDYTKVSTVEPYIILNGSEGHCLPCYGLKPGTRFYDDCGDERKADDDTIIFFRDGKWIIRFTYEMNSVVDEIERDYPVCEEAENFEVVINVPKVCLAWATKKRHIAIDGEVLCDPKHITAGYSVKNGQYNTLSLSGLPTYKKTTHDVRFTHGDGFIDFAPLDKQPFFIDTKSICIKCQEKYKSCFINKKVSEAAFNNPYQNSISKIFNNGNQKNKET